MKVITRVLLWTGLAPVSALLRLVGPHYRAFRWLVSSCPPGVARTVGRWRAVRARDHALARVPAFRDFAASGGTVTDKANYVNRYAIAQRCVGGRLPARAVAIDESSGSTGTPYNWVRGADE